MNSNLLNRRILFIGGLHRSGTSLVFRCLRDHPEISGFEGTGVPEEEGQHLQSVYSPARAHGGPGRFGFDKNSFLDEYSPLVSKENASRLFAEWSQHWDLHCSVLLEKSPPNLVRTRFLQALFPNSCFLLILRHPVAVAFATQKWSRTTLDSLLSHWQICHKKMRADLPYLHRAMILRYEDFVADPTLWLSRIQDFVGVAPMPLVRSVRSDVNLGYFDKWHALRSTDRPQYFRLLGRHYLGCKRFGYSLWA